MAKQLNRRREQSKLMSLRPAAWNRRTETDSGGIRPAGVFSVRGFVMDEFFSHALDQPLERNAGPLCFRFVVQPIAGSIAAVRAGVRDAEAHESALLRTVFFNPSNDRRFAGQSVPDVFFSPYLPGLATHCRRCTGQRSLRSYTWSDHTLYNFAGPAPTEIIAASMEGRRLNTDPIRRTIR